MRNAQRERALHVAVVALPILRALLARGCNCAKTLGPPRTRLIFCIVIAPLGLSTQALANSSRLQTANQVSIGNGAAQRQAPARPTHAGEEQAALIERKLKEAHERMPGSFEANHHLGEFYIQQQKLTAAVPFLEKAQQINSSHYVNSYDLALAYLHIGNLSKARQQIQSMLKRKDAAELRNLLGEVEEKAGNLVPAAEEYQRAAQMETSEQNLLDLGNILVKLTAYEEAIKVFNYAVGRYQRSSTLRVGLGIAHYSHGRYEDAIKTLCEAADLEPSDPRPFLFLGEMYNVSAELADEITKRMRQFVELHPKNALAHYYYAMNLGQGRHNHARPVDLNRIEALLKTAIMLDPRLSLAHLELGVILSDQQKFFEAINELRKAIDLQPDLARAHYRLGLIYQRTGQKALATQEMDIYKRLSGRKAKPAPSGQ